MAGYKSTPCPPPHREAFPPPPQNFASYGHASVAPAPATQQTLVITHQIPMAQQRYPVRTRCIHCDNYVNTNIRFETGSGSWLMCLVLSLFGCVLGCCLLPFCLQSCKNAVHTCPNCGNVVGSINQ